MNWLIAISVTAVLFAVGMIAVYTLFNPYSIVANIAGGLVGIGSAAIGLVFGGEY